MRASAKKAVSLITNDSEDEAGGDQVQHHSVSLHSSTARQQSAQACFLSFCGAIWQFCFLNSGASLRVRFSLQPLVL
jgi:hypothetical protein